MDARRWSVKRWADCWETKVLVLSWAGRVRAVAADLNRRGPRTALIDLVLAKVADEMPLPPDRHSPIAARADEIWRLMSRVYGRRPVARTNVAPLAIAAAQARDSVAGPDRGSGPDRSAHHLRGHRR